MAEGAWSGLRRALGYGFRALTSAFMAVVVIGAIYWGWLSYEARRLEKRVSVTKTWPDLDVPMKTPAKVTLKTRCTNSRLYYQLRIEPKTELKGPSEAKDSKTTIEARQRPPGQAQEKAALVEQILRQISDYTVELLDDDGFKVVEISVKTQSLNLMVDNKGRGASLDANGSDSCDDAAYDRATRITISWKDN
jgi:hypothetical protein